MIPLKIDWGKWSSVKTVKKVVRKIKQSREAKKALEIYKSDPKYILISHSSDGDYIFEDSETGVRFKVTKNGDIERLND